MTDKATSSIEDTSKDVFTIGELARRCNVSQRTIHFYEQKKLLFPAQRKGSGYRYYDETAIERLELIHKLKSIGLSLDEITEVIELYFVGDDGVMGKRAVVGLLKQHLVAVDRKIQELASFRDELTMNIGRINALIEMAERKR